MAWIFGAPLTMPAGKAACIKSLLELSALA